MAVSKITYSADTAIALDPSSLATSADFTAGMESDEVDNTSNLYMDALVYAKGITGHASTAPTIGQYIGLWMWGAKESLGTTAIDTLDGTTSAETLAHESLFGSTLQKVGSPRVTVATAGLVYYFPPFSVRSVWGSMPAFWGLFLAHNHTGALAAAQSARFSYMGITYTST